MEINELPLTICQFQQLAHFHQSLASVMISGRQIA
jgi:hypothetical protein